MLKNSEKKKDLNGVSDGEFHQINENNTKEPNRNFRTEIYHIFKNTGQAEEWNKGLANCESIGIIQLKHREKNKQKIITISKTCGTI